MAIESGKDIPAFVAGPPSPQGSVGLEQSPPLPATVLMMPSGLTRRTRRVLPSPMYRLLSGPTARDRAITVARVAGPRSPQGRFGAGQELPLPATVVMMPFGSTRRTRRFSLSA